MFTSAMTPLWPSRRNMESDGALDRHGAGALSDIGKAFLRMDFDGLFNVRRFASDERALTVVKAGLGHVRRSLPAACLTCSLSFY